MCDIAGLRQGDHAAFEKVYKDYSGRALAFFIKRVAWKDLAGELAQLTFIKLWNSRSTLSAEHALETQLFRIAGSVLIDHFRREAVRNKMHASLLQIGEDQLQVLSGHQVIESAEQLRFQLQRLTPTRRKVVLLKTREGFSNKEISGILSLSEKTVEGHITSAIRQFNGNQDR